MSPGRSGTGEGKISSAPRSRGNISLKKSLLVVIDQFVADPPSPLVRQNLGDGGRLRKKQKATGHLIALGKFEGDARIPPLQLFYH